MTSKEGIKILKGKMDGQTDTSYERAETVRMAIKALEQDVPDINAGDMISRQAVFDAMYELCNTGETLKVNPWRDNPHIDAVIESIEQLSSITPQSCEDAISRQKAIDAVDALYLNGDSSASYLANAEGDTLIGKYQAITALDDLPPVTPRPKTGHWQQDLDGTYLCSECGSGFKEQPTLMGKPMFAWCPSCGAKMVESQESEVEDGC